MMVEFTSNSEWAACAVAVPIRAQADNLKILAYNQCLFQ
jgi:hypothetical protein